jgi:hypothetical protein
LCRAVKVTVESQGDDGDKTITVSATRRSELDPAFLSIPPVQLKVLSTSPRSSPAYEFSAEIEAVFSVPDEPAGLTYTWTATGGATISGGKTATLIADDDDRYEVELKVGDGVSDSTAYLSLTFENRLPQIDPASIVINPENPNLGGSIGVSATALDPDSTGSLLTYSWIGPAGSVICSAPTCSTVQVASPDFVEGRNEIRLVVTDGDGGTQSATKEITVGPAGGGNPDDPPTTSSGDWVYANAKYRLSEPVGEEEVTATWSTSDTDLDQMTGWELHRGTPGTGTLVGSGSAGLSFSHTFAADAPPGDYTIRQLVGSGAPVDVQFRLNKAPKADFVATNLPGVAPYEVIFDDSSTDDAGVASWHWEFGYPAWQSDSANPRFRFPNPGTYLVSMDVSDGEGGSDRVVQTVNIGGSPAKPAAVTWVGDSVTFPQVAGASQYSLDITHTGTNPDGSGCLTGGPWKVSPKPPLNEPIVESIVDNPCDVDVSTTVTLQVQANDIWSAKSDPAEKP